jgi:hypothetical protein
MMLGGNQEKPANNIDLEGYLKSKPFNDDYFKE